MEHERVDERINDEVVLLVRLAEEAAPIVDDDADMLRLLSMRLNSAGYRVSTAGSGTDGTRLGANIPVTPSPTTPTTQTA